MQEIKFKKKEEEKIIKRNWSDFQGLIQKIEQKYGFDYNLSRELLEGVIEFILKNNVIINHNPENQVAYKILKGYSKELYGDEWTFEIEE